MRLIGIYANLLLQGDELDSLRVQMQKDLLADVEQEVISLTEEEIAQRELDE